MNIIDRRPNPKGKSLANRQRFIDRARGEVKKALVEALKRRKVGESEGSEKISIPTRGISEPFFRRGSQGGRRDYVVPGNKKYVVGDRIERPQGGEGGGRGAASNEDGGEQDAFEFVLSKEEFLNLFFEDLELPDLIKTRMKETEATQLARAGFSIAGTPASLNLVRTMRNSLARHEKGLFSDGAFLEALHSHTSVVFQPDFDDPRYNGINPYALGFAMMRDIKRLTLEPTEEDREWFPELAGNGIPMGPFDTPGRTIETRASSSNILARASFANSDYSR